MNTHQPTTRFTAPRFTASRFTASHFWRLILLAPLLGSAGGGISDAAAQGFYQVEIIVISFDQTDDAALEFPAEVEEDTQDTQDTLAASEAERFERLLVFNDSPDTTQADKAAPNSGGGIVPEAVAATLAPILTGDPSSLSEDELESGPLLLQKMPILNEHPAYNVLRYQRWLQASAPREEIDKMRVWAHDADDGDADSKLQGEVHIYTSGPYLQTEVDLRYRPPGHDSRVLSVAAPLGLAMDYAPPYRLYEQRRVRLREVHYYDHPKFGVLLIVTRSAAPTINPEDSTVLRHPAAPHRIAPPTSVATALRYVTGG